MASLSIVLLDIASTLHHWLRETAYTQMARQAVDWSPDHTLVEKKLRGTQPLRLDFSVDKKNRLQWARRRAGQLPH